MRARMHGGGTKCALRPYCYTHEGLSLPPVGSSLFPPEVPQGWPGTCFNRGMKRISSCSSAERRDSWIRVGGTECRLGILFGVLLAMTACGGAATTAEDADSDSGGDGDGDGDTSGDGDGDLSGDGDGDVVGDGDGDGDVVCDDRYAYGITAVVVGGGADGGGGQNRILPPDDGAPVPVPTCLSTVVAVDGDYMETLECYSTGVDCECYGAGERPGTYTVTATLGELSEQQTAVVESDGCHVQAVPLTFFEVR